MLQPLPVTFLVWSIATAFAIIAAFLMLANYARKETVVAYCGA